MLLVQILVRFAVVPRLREPVFPEVNVYITLYIQLDPKKYY